MSQSMPRRSAISNQFAVQTCRSASHQSALGGVTARPHTSKTNRTKQQDERSRRGGRRIAERSMLLKSNS